VKGASLQRSRLSPRNATCAGRWLGADFARRTRPSARPSDGAQSSAATRSRHALLSSSSIGAVSGASRGEPFGASARGRSLTTTRHSAPCASSSSVARSSSLSPGCATGARGRERIRRVRHALLGARAVAHRVTSFGYPVGPRGAAAPLCMEFSGDADGARRVEALERLSGCARRNSTSPTAGEITTETRPAATSAAALA